MRDLLIAVFFLGYWSLAGAFLGDEAMETGEYHRAIALYSEQVHTAPVEERSGVQMALAIAYLRDQDEERAWNAFLDALERAPVADATPQMAPQEEREYEEALQFYLKHTGRQAQQAAVQLRERYGRVADAHPDYYQLNYLVALAEANEGCYEAFMRRFYASYLLLPDHFLAYKTKALLHLKLRERARDPDQASREATQVYRYAREALARNERDISLIQLTLQFAPVEEKTTLLEVHLNNMMRDNMIVARGDLLFFIKMAVALDRMALAERFLAKARTWYPTSRSLDEASRYLYTERKNGAGTTHTR